MGSDIVPPDRPALLQPVNVAGREEGISCPGVLSLRPTWHAANGGCRIIGHGMEAEGELFCCAYRAKHAGAPQVKDRAQSATPT
jgi:hypothetical protein